MQNPGAVGDRQSPSSPALVAAAADASIVDASAGAYQSSKTRYAIAYLRVSTDQQTVENQRLLISEFAEKNAYMVLDWYADEGVSGSVPATERAAFVKMLDFIKSNPGLDAILVYEVSRLGRTFYDTIDVIRTIEQKIGIPIISCSPKEWFLQNADKMARQMTLSMYSIFAEREKDLISQRTKEGLARVKASGKPIGRPRKVINRDNVTKLLLQHVPRYKIAQIIGVSRVTLYNELNAMQLVKRYNYSK